MLSALDQHHNGKANGRANQGNPVNFPASSIAKSVDHRQPSTKHIYALIQSRSNHFIEAHGSTSPPPERIMMRAINVQAFAQVLPITVAAQFLQNFYSTIAIKASGEWLSQPESDRLVFTSGPFQLTFSSVGASIPWTFVKRMADMLREFACLGWTNLFDAYFVDAITETIGIALSLRFANEDGSWSSVGSTNTREGSVPSVGSPYD